MYGINTAMVTPFDDKGCVDFAAMSKHIDFLISKGVHNLYPLGTMGEYALMDVTERKDTAEKVVNYVGGKVGVFIHIGAMTQKDAVELAKHAYDIGADGVGAISPFFYHVSQQELYDYYAAISAAVPEDFPIYMYNLPGMTGNDILPATVAKLAELPNIAGIKNTMANDARISELYRGCPSDFTIISGDDLIGFAGLSLGAKGLVSGTSNVFPELFVSMYNCVQNNDLAGAAARQNQIHQVLALLDYDLRPGYVKEILRMRGLDRSYSRAPLMTCCTEESYNRIQTGLQQIFAGTDITL